MVHGQTSIVTIIAKLYTYPNIGENATSSYGILNGEEA